MTKEGSTQEDINYAVNWIINNMKDFPCEALEKLSFALWVEQQIRIKPQEKLVCQDCDCMNPTRCNLRGM